MSWQDIVLSIGVVIFIIALIPSVKSKDKPALASSLMTGGVLTIFIIVYLSLGLWFSTVTSVVLALVWFTLAYQKFQINKKGKNV